MLMWVPQLVHGLALVLSSYYNYLALKDQIQGTWKQRGKKKKKTTKIKQLVNLEA